MKENLINQDFKSREEEQVYTANIEVGGESLNSMIMPLSSNTTGPLNLRTPAVNEFYNVADFNSNFSAINNAVSVINQRLSQLESGGSVSLPAIPASISVPTSPVQNGASYAVSWSAVTGATTYDLERRTGTGAWVGIAAGVIGTSRTETAPASGTSMQHRVRARNSAGNSAWRESSTTTLTSGATQPMPPASITVPSSVWAGNSYTVSWALVIGATSYNLDRSRDGGSWTRIATGVTVTSFSLMAPQSGSSMIHRVSANNAAGGSYWRNSSTTTLYGGTLIDKTSSVTFDNAYSHFGLNPFAIWPELKEDEEKVALALSMNPGLDINAQLPEGVERDSLISPGVLSGIVIENKVFDGEGLSLCYAMRDITVRNCTFKNCKIGIRGVHLSESVIQNNTFINCETGIHMVSSNDITISGNNIKAIGSENDGMFFKNIKNFDIRDNILTNGQLKINGSYDSNYSGNKFYEGSDVCYMPSKNTERNEGL